MSSTSPLCGVFRVAPFRVRAGGGRSLVFLIFCVFREIADVGHDVGKSVADLDDRLSMKIESISETVRRMEDVVQLLLENQSTIDPLLGDS